LNKNSFGNKISVMNEKPALRIVVLLAALITAVCAVVFFAHRPVLSAGALSFDDNQYLTEDNLLVQKPSLKSAFKILTEVLNPSSTIGYYQPLSIISIMLDYAAGGSDKNLEPFHRTNLILHIFNTALLIVLLYIIFGQPVPAAMAGLLFGVHPLTVEPIAWISDRKTVLAMFFALWCLIFYVRYTREKGWGLYIASILMYVFAMMSKPTSLPLAAALLVTDYWPLQRITAKLENIKGLILEKLPFFVLGGAFAVITVISNTRSIIAPSSESSVATKLSQLPVMICYLIEFYLNKIIWPVNLSSVYPMPAPMGLSNPKVLGGVINTVIVVIILLYSARRIRVFLGGGLFFLVVIFPTLGLVRFSPWVVASDKYVYMPAVGLLMILAWCFGRLWKSAEQKITKQMAGLIVLVLFLSATEIWGTRQYLLYWHSTQSLYEYMLKLTPNAAPVHENLGNVLQSQGRFDEAAGHYSRMLQQDANSMTAHNNLGSAFLQKGELDKAIGHFNKALQLNPNYADAHNNLGIALALKGKTDEAISHYQRALQLRPFFSDAHNNLGILLQSQGRFDEALEHYRQTLQLKPDYLASMNGVAWILATGPDPNARDINEAVILAERAVKLTKNQNFVILDTLAAAYASAGRFDEAVNAAKKAVELVRLIGQKNVADEISKKLVLYENRKAYRRPPEPALLKP